MSDMPENRIKELRLSRGLKQEHLALELGLVVATIDRYEKGKGGIPDSRKAALAKYFNVSIAYLMGWDNDNGNGEPAVGEVA